MKNLALQTFLFIYALLEQHLPANYYFLIFFNHVLTHKGDSLLLSLIQYFTAATNKIEKREIYNVDQNLPITSR